MNKRIRTRLAIILGVTILSISLFAGFPPSLAKMKEKVHLGLDLRGGTHLVLEVVTDDAIRAETDQAIYRYVVTTGTASAAGNFVRYRKPTGADAQLVSVAEYDRRAQVLLGFARFPLARVDGDNCVGQALVHLGVGQVALALAGLDQRLEGLVELQVHQQPPQDWPSAAGPRPA